MKKILFTTIGVLLIAAACNKKAPVPPSSVQPAPIQVPAPPQPTLVPPPNPPVSPMIFDPAKAKVGDKVGSMIITSISGNTVIKFKGPVTITGTYVPQVSDLRSGCPQFSGLDAASLAKIPRITGDNSAFWFCFGNPDFTKPKLGSESKQTTVTIDNYTIDNRQTPAASDANLISVQ